MLEWVSLWERLMICYIWAKEIWAPFIPPSWSFFRVLHWKQRLGQRDLDSFYSSFSIHFFGEWFIKRFPHIIMYESVKFISLQDVIYMVQLRKLLHTFYRNALLHVSIGIFFNTFLASIHTQIIQYWNFGNIPCL